MPAATFALLDDHVASPAAPRSRLYESHVGTLSCTAVSDLPAMLANMQQALAGGRHAVVLFSYELGAALHGIAPHSQGGPLAEVLLFDRCQLLSTQQVDAWLANRCSSDDIPAGIANVRASVNRRQFAAALARIHAYIEAGDTYQVNYTYRLHFDTFGSPFSLYRKLRARQPVPYGALIGLAHGRMVLSLSPELFVQHTQGRLTVRPMKGTAAATGDAKEDAIRAAALAADPKNRAENLMIVDLLRNDLGRIAEIGSVSVSDLFAVQRYSSVLQMTSTVHARLRSDAGVPEIIDALYPCGSITGAPKHRTMQIIRELEPDARGIYTGAIGWFAPPVAGQKTGEFCLSVPIRTLMLQAQKNGVRRAQLGVGAGIVHDSDTQDEYAECALKASFLTALPMDFELFETMRAGRDGCALLERHLARLQASAAYFGFTWDEAAIRATVRDACDAFPDAAPRRLRLALRQDGSASCQSGAIVPLDEPVRLLQSSRPTSADDLFLRHKTTVRTGYDAAWREAERQHAFDMLFFNQAGELTEGGRSSVFVKLDGCWYTPPASCGLLPGIMRGVLLEDPAWSATERILTAPDLKRAEAIMVCNALRGPLRAQLA